MQKLIVAALLFVGTALQSMQQQMMLKQEVAEIAERVEHKYCVVRGDIHIVRCYDLARRGYDQTKHNDNLAHIVDEAGTPIVIEPDDMLVNVWVFSEECPCWSVNKHPLFGHYTFPERLPLFLVDDKKEGDMVTCFFRDPTTDKTFQLLLQCKQLADEYSYSFEKTIEILKRNEGYQHVEPFTDAYWEKQLQKAREHQKIMAEHEYIALDKVSEKTEKKEEEKQIREVAEQTALVAVGKSYHHYEGDVAVYKSAPYTYPAPSKENINIFDMNGNPVETDGPWVRVGVYKRSVGQFFCPTVLVPASLLVGKDTGDTVILFAKKDDESGELVKMELTCAAFGRGTFEEAFRWCTDTSICNRMKRATSTYACDAGLTGNLSIVLAGSLIALGITALAQRL